MKSRISKGVARALLAAACGGLAACTTASWQQFFYDVGDNYACQQSGAHKRDANARASQCADPQHPDRSRYQDYEDAREKASTPQP